MSARKDMEDHFQAILPDQTTGSNVHDFELRRAVASLGLSVLKLGASSTRLAIVNIILTIVLVIIGGIQICFVIRGA